MGQCFGINPERLQVTKAVDIIGFDMGLNVFENIDRAKSLVEPEFG